MVYMCFLIWGRQQIQGGRTRRPPSPNCRGPMICYGPCAAFLLFLALLAIQFKTDIEI